MRVLVLFMLVFSSIVYGQELPNVPRSLNDSAEFFAGYEFEEKLTYGENIRSEFVEGEDNFYWALHIDGVQYREQLLPKIPATESFYEKRRNAYLKLHNTIVAQIHANPKAIFKYKLVKETSMLVGSLTFESYFQKFEIDSKNQDDLNTFVELKILEINEGQRDLTKSDLMDVIEPEMLKLPLSTLE